LSLIKGFEGFKIDLKELLEMIIPFFETEILCQEVETVIPENIERSKVLIQTQNFLREYEKVQNEYELQVFNSTLLSTAYQKLLIILVANIWNPFNPEETSMLVNFMKIYIEKVYISTQTSISDPS
jgi:hypothetical protein